MLPVDVPPQAGEALPAWLQRTAALLRADAGLLYSHIGLRPFGRTVRQVQLALPASLVAHIADATGHNADQVASTVAQVLPGLDLHELVDPTCRAPDRAVQRRQWIHLTGTRWCSGCVAEGGTWRLEWQIPWVFACVEHGLLLLDRCPACGRRPDLVPRGGDRVPAASITGCGCGHRWEQSEPGRPAGPSELSEQADLLAALNGVERPLWGQDAGGFERLAAWRAASAFVASHDAARAWSHRPFLVPPTTASRSAELVERVASLMHARTLVDASDEFGDLAKDGHGWGEPRVWDHIPATTPLTPVVRRWLQRSGRVHAQLRRTQREAFALAPVRPAVVPTLAPAGRLPARWRQVSVPVEVMRRAALSLAVARLAGAGTWAVAGEWLGIDGGYASRLVRHVLGVLGPGSPQELTAAAMQYAKVLRSVGGERARPEGAPLRSASELTGFDRTDCDR